MRYLIKLAFCIFLLICNNLYSREIGETEITTQEGIEVFQNEKYYLLKKNVKIESDNFTLIGDIVKIFFEKDLYDIKIINASGNVELNSFEYSLNASGEKLIFTVDEEKILIEGNDSLLITNDSEMYSDGKIQVNNISGDFLLNGPNSILKTQDIFIEGRFIDGIINKENELNDIINLNVNDENIAYIKTEDTDMYAKIVRYNKDTSLIELENNVKIIRGGETITGDYGTLDTNTNSYKVQSKNSKKVRVIISNQDE